MIPTNYAYHFVDHIQSTKGKLGFEDKFLLIKSLNVAFALKTEFNDSQ